MPINTIASILAELRRFGSFDDFMKSEDSEGNWMPGFVATGDGRSLYFTRKAERLVDRLAQELKRQQPSLAKSHTDSEWKNAVRRSLGPAISQCEDTDDLKEDARAVLSTLESELSLDRNWGTSSMSFGVSLFSSSRVDAFEIGPVRIEPRAAWLERRYEAGNVTLITKRRIERLWQGRRLRKRRSSADSLAERDLIDSIGSCESVCSVTTDGLAPDFARTKATVAAHLCLAIITLAWDHPSKTLQGFWLENDPGPLRQRYLHALPGKRMYASRYLVGLPHASNISREDWEKYCRLHAGIRRAAGVVLHRYLAIDDDPIKPDVSIALFHAMLWFYEACRESLDHSALVKFAASLDALAAGRDVHGILRLIEARTGLTGEKSLFAGEHTVAGLVKEIYKRRSQSIHGNSKVARHDAADLRMKSEKLARLCLLEALAWLDKHSPTADPTDLQLA